MADKENRFSDISAFFSRLQGQDRIRKGKSTLTVLNSPETSQEREQKQKIISLAQYVRNKNWNRRHIEFFDEYRKMVFTYPIIKAAIDIYGEEVCTVGDDNNIFSIECEDEEIKKELETCYFKQLKLNSKGFLVVRELCKFGNVYGNLITRPKDGVVDIVFFPPETVMREQMYNPENLDAYRFLWYGGGGGNNHYEPWEIVHWRNAEDIEMEPYGSSILRPILDTWRRIVLMREALVIYRITRAPSKLLFKIGTDGMTGEEAFRFAQNLKKEMTKKPLVNPQTGEIDFKYNPMSIEENIYMPTYEGSPSDVSVLEGASNLDAVEDYKIIKDDLFAGLKIPKSFLSFEEDLSNKSALSEEDVRFSRTIQRLQQAFAEGLVHIGIVHLFMKGYSKKELESFTIKMNNPSTTAEKKKIELVEARLNIAKSAWDYNNNSLNIMSNVGVLKDILKFTDDEVQQTIKAQITEKKIMWRLQQLRENGTYEDPEIDKKLAQMKGLSGTEGGPSGFDALEFEGATITEIVSKKIDQELKEMFKPVQASPTTNQVSQLTEGTLVKNIRQAKKDMGIE